MVGLTPDTRVEAVDGPVAVCDLVGKGMPILTRLPSGARGFRIFFKVTPSADPVAVVRIVLDNGHETTLARQQVVYKVGHESAQAENLQAGDVLEASFYYPPGYRPQGPDLQDVRVTDSGFRVVAVEGAGNEIVYTGRVNETGCLFLTAGILCCCERR